MTPKIILLLAASLFYPNMYGMDTNNQTYDCDAVYAPVYNELANTIATGNVKEFKRHLDCLSYCGFEDRRCWTIDSSSGATALHYCITHAFIEGIKILCENAHSNIIEMTDKAGYTPLMWAIHHNKPDIVQLLLNYRCNPVPRCNPNDKAMATSMQKCPAALPMLAAASTIAITDLPEDVLLKIWRAGLNTDFENELHLFEQHHLVIKHIAAPMQPVALVCKLWNRLWNEKKAAIIDMCFSENADT